MSQSVTPIQRAILEFLSLADGEGAVLAYDIAGGLGLSPRGMGGRMGGLWQRGLVERVVVRPAPSPRSDALIGWQLTSLGRTALNG
jgi:hypothetical protein